MEPSPSWFRCFQQKNSKLLAVAVLLLVVWVGSYKQLLTQQKMIPFINTGCSFSTFEGDATFLEAGSRNLGWVRRGPAVNYLNELVSHAIGTEKISFCYSNTVVYDHVHKNAGLTFKTFLDGYVRHANHGKSNKSKRIHASSKTHVLRLAVEHENDPESIYFDFNQKAKICTPWCFTVMQNHVWFTFIRNPWDRFLSYAHHDLTLLGHDLPTSEMVQGVLEGKHRALSANHFRLQLYTMVNEDGNFIVDFIGRFSHIVEDFEAFLTELNDPKMLTYYDKHGLPRQTHSNRGFRPKLLELSQEDVKLLGCYYKEDIQLFGFSVPLKVTQTKTYQNHPNNP